SRPAPIAVVGPGREEPRRHALAVPVEQVDLRLAGGGVRDRVRRLARLEHLEVLDGDGLGEARARALAERSRAAHAGAALVVERALRRELLERVRLLGVLARDHV